MIKGLQTTLLAVAISVAGVSASYAFAPVIRDIPDVTIGDREDNIGTDNNFFVFTNAFKFDDYVTDQDTTPVSTLAWTFDEDNNPSQDLTSSASQYFVVNNKAPLHVGSAALANDVATSNVAHQVASGSANELRSVSAYATFRDVVFTPTATGPGIDPNTLSGNRKAAHAAGKLVRFYVADGSNVSTNDIFVNSIDNTTSDALTGGIPFVPQIDQDFNTNSTGWNTVIGLSSTGSTAYDGTFGSLQTQVAQDNTPPTGYRIVGWITDATNVIYYSTVGSGKFVRAKYFMFARGQATIAVNEIPQFRIRVANRFAVTAFQDIFCHTNGDPEANGLAQDIRPSQTPASPSVYRVDLDPIDVPQLVSNPATEGFLRAFETYANEPQENGFLSMTECVIGTYTALPNNVGVVPVTQNGLITVYAPTASNGGDFAAATLTALKYAPPGTVGDPASVDSNPPLPSVTVNNLGVTLETLSVESTRYGVAVWDTLAGTVAQAADRTIRPRVEPGKIYKIRFHATSTQSTVNQAQTRFRARSIKFQWTSELDVAQGLVGGSSQAISQQAAPGTGNQNPEKLAAETNGGWYNVIMTSPMDSTIQASQPNLNSMDPPGVSTDNLDNAKSRRDILVGCDVLDQDVLSQGAASEAGQMTVDRIEINKYDKISD